jgi:hypothetical protein
VRFKRKTRANIAIKKDNKLIPEENFIVTSALFYWYIEETVNWLKLAVKTFEHLLEQSKSSYLKEFYELKKSEAFLSPHNHTKESKGG